MKLMHRHSNSRAFLRSSFKGVNEDIDFSVNVPLFTFSGVSHVLGA